MITDARRRVSCDSLQLSGRWRWQHWGMMREGNDGSGSRSRHILSKNWLGEDLCNVGESASTLGIQFHIGLIVH